MSPPHPCPAPLPPPTACALSCLPAPPAPQPPRSLPGSHPGLSGYTIVAYLPSLNLWSKNADHVILILWCWSGFALWLGTGQFLWMFPVCLEWGMFSSLGVQNSVYDGSKSFLILLLICLEAILVVAHNLECSEEFFFQLSLRKSPLYPLTFLPNSVLSNIIIVTSFLWVSVFLVYIFSYI